MKICSIILLFDGEEHLIRSMRSIRVDLFIIVWQDISNYGESYNALDNVDLSEFNCVFVKYDPDLSMLGMWNEKRKRNIGLNVARQNNCTHFLFSDADEVYPDFEAGLQEFKESGANGSVCKILTYFKSENLRLENPDNYFVPFIHELKPDTVAGIGNYPFYVDPTRKVNTGKVVELSIFMHHYSWVRTDIYRKVRNSSAKRNIERSQLLADYLDPNTGAGTFLKDYGQKLISLPDVN